MKGPVSFLCGAPVSQIEMNDMLGLVDFSLLSTNDTKSAEYAFLAMDVVGKFLQQDSKLFVGLDGVPSIREAPPKLVGGVVAALAYGGVWRAVRQRGVYCVLTG
jgi:hypothetical protein